MNDIQFLCFFRLRYVALCQGVCQATKQTPYISLESPFLGMGSNFKHNFYIKTKKKSNLHAILEIKLSLKDSRLFMHSFFKKLFSINADWSFSVCHAPLQADVIPAFRNLTVRCRQQQNSIESGTANGLGFVGQTLLVAFLQHSKAAVGER